jgi:hypothetical protein
MAGLCKGKHKIMVDRLESILRSGLAYSRAQTGNGTVRLDAGHNLRPVIA